MTEGASLLRGKRYIHGEPGSRVPATAAAPAMNRPRPWQLARRYRTAWRTAPLLIPEDHHRWSPRTIPQTRTSPATRPRRLQRTSRIGIPAG
jgi:hypothetical protein